MYNPSYLIKSRHGIFYFRYPLPSGPSSRISISLKTRCPKEALRLAKSLEYHSSVLIEKMDLERMDHADIILIMRSYYTGLLEAKKAEIDRDGPLTKRRVQGIENILEELDEIIEDGEYDDPQEYYGYEHENPEAAPFKKDLQG